MFTASFYLCQNPIYALIGIIVNLTATTRQLVASTLNELV